MTRLGDTTFPDPTPADPDTPVDLGRGYYVHTNAWPAYSGGPEMSLAEVTSAIESMDTHYRAAVRTLQHPMTAEASHP